MVVKIEPRLLMKMQWYFLAIAIPFAILCFSLLPIPFEYGVVICSVFNTLGVFLLFFLNRNELTLLQVTPADKLDLSFINKSFFKRQDLLLEKNQYEIVTQKDIFLIKVQGKLMAVVRRSTMSDEDWNTISVYFTNQ
ncbi:hypothetical protein ACE38W_17335 [Chitinophaga sp. Hz27]|uniref:hypothetical protein n=1 Tax=Chitinophaga sp. Hz27 TaxID=3347169 RepID=UPI0035DF7D1C